MIAVAHVQMMWSKKCIKENHKMKPQNMKPLGALKFHEQPIDAIDVTFSLIAAGSSDGYVTIWNVYNKE